MVISSRANARVVFLVLSEKQIASSHTELNPIGITQIPHPNTSGSTSLLCSTTCLLSPQWEWSLPTVRTPIKLPSGKA